MSGARLAAALALALAPAACGPAASGGAAGSTTAGAPGTAHATPPSCDALIAHLAVVFGQDHLAATDRADLVASCEKSDPPPAERACVMAAQTGADVDACGRALHAQAGGARPDGRGPTPPATPPPGDEDIRAEILALGQRIDAYQREMGEPPPAAGPTPAVGACCAAACGPDEAGWTGPWQLVRFGLDRATRWSFQVVPDEHGAAAYAAGCDGTIVQLHVARGGAAPTEAEIVVTAATPAPPPGGAP